jgi:polar amino acid transport system substrate-binding protein
MPKQGEIKPMRHFFFLSYLIVVFFFTGIMSGCATQAGKTPGPTQQTAKKLNFKNPDQLQAIRARGTLRVGVSIFVPWVMHGKEGRLIGYEVDVARKLAEDIGVPPEFIETSWPSILTGLLAEDYDIIISGLSLTPQRALLINFSMPYNHSSSTLLANVHLAGTFHTAQRFNRKAITIGVVKNSVGEEPLRRQLPKAAVKTFDSEAQLIGDLLAGKLYAMVSSAPRTGYLLSRHKGVIFRPDVDPISKHAEGFGIRKGDPDILNFLNTWIQYNTQNGWLPAKHSYWFDTIDWADQL